MTYSGKQAKIMENFLEFMADIEQIPRNTINKMPLKQEFLRLALDHLYWHYRELFRRWMKGEEIEIPTKGLNEIDLPDDDKIKDYPKEIVPLEDKNEDDAHGKKTTN